MGERLKGFTVVSCFCQNKEELILELNNTTSSFFIKASLQPSFCCLSFPEGYNRAKKNSIDLFPEIILKKVVDIVQYENERSFSIDLEDGLSLLFKMHGNLANIVLFQQGMAISIFRNQFKADLEISLHALNRSIEWNKKSFIQHLDQLPATYFTFGKAVWYYLNENSFHQKAPDEKWELLQSTLKKLNQPTFYIAQRAGKLILTLLPIENATIQYQDPITAINEFYNQYISTEALSYEKGQALRDLAEQLKNKTNYVLKNKKKLEELTNDQRYQLWGDLIMANMHEIKQGIEIITLESFYDQKPVEIKLKRELNAQRNAEVFYRKAKNQQIEIDKLTESIAAKEKEIITLESNTEKLRAITDFKSLRLETRDSPKPKQRQVPLPYHEFEFKGFKIWVGKNAEANDQLTLKHSFKEDLWLHAKDVAGSHVLIKHQANKPFPKDVIERAAQLAAYNSKRKNESLCPVSITAKKFVRKRKGDPAGAVVVEKEKVILVEPQLFQS